jgi:hypothetical protein
MRDRRVKRPLRRPTLSSASRNSTMVETIFLIGLVIAVFIVFWLHQLVSVLMVSSVSGPGPVLSLSDGTSSGRQRGQVRSPAAGSGLRGGFSSTTTQGGFKHLLDIALDLAALEPTELLRNWNRTIHFKHNASIPCYYKKKHRWNGY